MDRRGRQIEFQRLPVSAIVEGDVDAIFRAGEEQALVLGVFANDVGEAGVRETVGDSRPGFAEVGGPEDVGLEVVQLVAIDGDVGGAGGERRGFDDADETPLAEFFRGDVGPVLAAVAGDVHEAVVRTGPDDAFLDGRSREREDRVVILDAGVVLRERTAGRALLGFVVAREVAAELRPGHAAVGGLKDGFAAVINGVGLVGRNHDGSGPLEAMLEVGGAGAHGIERPGRDVVDLMRFLVEARDEAVVGAGVNDVGVVGVGNDKAGFAPADFVPIGFVDGALVAAAGDGDGGIVLQRAVNVVRNEVVSSYVVELRGGLIALGGPRLAAVMGDSGSAVVGVDHPVGMRGINPEAVIIAVRRTNDVERVAAVGGTIDRRV